MEVAEEEVLEAMIEVEEGHTLEAEEDIKVVEEDTKEVEVDLLMEEEVILGVEVVTLEAEEALEVEVKGESDDIIVIFGIQN